MTYTKADLERIVMTQLENLDAMHDLLTIMKVQNELIRKTNKKIQNDIAKLKCKEYPVLARKRRSE